MGEPDVDSGASARTVVEAALQHQRSTLLVLLVALPAACWTWVILMARDMYGSMRGAAGWMMTPDWDAPHVLLLWAMWAVMMVAMMLPSAAPVVLLYAGAVRQRSSLRRPQIGRAHV